MSCVATITTRLCAAIAVTALSTAVACTSNSDISPSPTPGPLPTPRPLPERVTFADAIMWLEDAGLSVEPATEDLLDERLARRYSAQSVMQVSVNGDPSLWLIEYQEPQRDEDLFLRFLMHASYPESRYPTFLTLNNMVYLMYGSSGGISETVLKALWDIAPPTEIASYGIHTADYRWTAETAVRVVAVWLIGRPETERFSKTGKPVMITTMQGFAGAYAFESLVDNLPHPDSPVWVSSFTDAGEKQFITVVSDFITGLPVAEARSDRPLDLSVIDPIRPPEISQVAAMDGADGEYDELHTVVQWRGSRTLIGASENWPEIIDSYVVERSPYGEEDWQPIAWLSRDAWDMTTERPTPLVPPAGRAEADYYGDDLVPLLSYWDYDVEPGVMYDYRVYGCTSLGRQTSYSQIVSAIAGDPDPSTPDLGAHVSSLVEPDCSREAR